MILKASESVSQDLIEKGFLVCGQSKSAKPEDIIDLAID